MDNKNAKSKEVTPMKKFSNIALLVFGVVMIVSGVIRIVGAL